MNRSRLLGVVCACLFVFSATASHAALVSRLGGQAYYDTVLDMTWLANANLADTNAFGTAGISASGAMNWDTANTWIANMNADGGTGYLGFNDWRMPTLGPINDVSFNTTSAQDGSADIGRNVSRPGTVYGGSTASEIAHLFFNTLGNVSDYDVTGTIDDGCPGSASCLVNTGPFSNLSTIYWFGLEYSPDTTRAWNFSMDQGAQGAASKTTSERFVFAVRSGDIAAVPIPAAAWLFFSGLIGLTGAARRKC